MLERGIDMFICLHCDGKFDEPDYIPAHKYYCAGDWSITDVAVCPYCGNEDYEDYEEEDEDEID